MSINSEIITKYFEEHPATAALAKKYGLKEELIVVDAFDNDSDEERLVLNDECFDKFLKAYLFSYSEDTQNVLKEAKSDGKSIEISAALLWMDKNFDKAIEYHMNNIIKKYSDVEYNYVSLSRIIARIINTCSFTPSEMDFKLTKNIANKLKEKYNNIIWNDEEYDIYMCLSEMSFNPGIKSSFNVGVSNCLHDESLDILAVLKTLKNVKSFLMNSKSKQVPDILLKSEIENLELNLPLYIPYIYKRLYKENKLEEVLNNPDKYIATEQISLFIKEEDEKYDITVDDESTDISTNVEDIPEENLVSQTKDSSTPLNVEDLVIFINIDIVKDVETCLKKYTDADFTKDEVINTIVKDVVETLFSMDKDIYNTSSRSYNQETLINSIIEAFTRNGLFIPKELVESNVNIAKNTILPVGRDFSNLLASNESLVTNDEIINDFKSIITPGVINKFNTLFTDEKEKLALDLIDILLSTNKEIYNKESFQYDEQIIIDSIYSVLKDYFFTKDFVTSAIKKENINMPIETHEALDDELYKIFNIEPEKDVKSSLELLYENSNDQEQFKNSVLSAYSNLINVSMYGTLRDIEKIENQFNLFCSENGINYSDEFIDSLPDIIKDRYKSPIVRQEQPEKKKGEVFKIVRRYIPKTSVKTQKRIYASIAGVGIISFLFMTGVKLISPDTAADSCTESFTRIFHNDLLGNIFGDIKTYFASIAASLGGITGYVIKDEKENKSRRM